MDAADATGAGATERRVELRAGEGRSASTTSAATTATATTTPPSLSPADFRTTGRSSSKWPPVGDVAGPDSGGATSVRDSRALGFGWASTG